MPPWRRDGRRARPTSRARLTDRAIRSIPPDVGRRVVVWDAVQRGLCLVVHPTGRRTFKVVYRFANRSRWYHIGDGSIGVAGARKIAARILLQVAAGADPEAERVSGRRAGTFGELADRYRDEWARRRNRSWRQADALVRRHLLPRWRNIPARQITRADVRSAFAAIAAPIVANQTLAAASAIFTWAVGQEAVPFNPCRGVEPNPTRGRERVLSDAEARILWPEFDATLRLALLTGARMIELEHMRAADVDLDGRVWTQPGAPSDDGEWPGTKNYKTHKVPLSEPALALIGEHIARRSRRRSKELLARLAAKHRLPRLTPHDLRRTFASWVAGHSGRAAMDRLLNHSDRSVSSIYDRFEYLEQDRAIMAAIARHVIRAIGGHEEDVVVRLR